MSAPITPFARAALCLSIALLLLPLTAFAAGEKKPPQTMPIQASLTVDWDVQSGDRRNEGKMTARMQGTAHLAEGMSMMDPMAPVGSFVTYAAKGVNVTWTYQEKVTEENPPEGCPPLVAEYEGGGAFVLEQINTAATSGLNIRKVGSLVPKEMMQFAPPEVHEMMIDYYDFFAVARDQEVRGRHRDGNDCVFKADTKEVNPFPLTVRFRITDEGKMKGSRKWSVDGTSGAPAFNILVSDLPASMEDQPLQPEPGGDEIHYDLSWNFGEVDPYVEIQRREGGEWVPIVEEPVEVKVGEKLELRGVVMPEAEDTGKGRWTVPGRPVQEFVVEGESGFVDWLEDTELDTQELTFHWWDGEDGLEVRYETTSKKGTALNGSASFNVAEPDTVLRAYLADGPFQIVPVGYTDPDGTRHEGNELVLGAGDGQTIRFCHDPLPSDFQPGSTQFVQYVRTTGRVTKYAHAMAGPCMQIENEGLDASYPYAPGPETRDSPCVPVSDLDLTISVTYDFTTQLMYKPETDGAIFVPLSELDWDWTGISSRGSTADDWIMGDSQAHVPPTGTPAESWMEWTNITTGNETWDACQ
jgi:hypothetical protein